MIGLGAGHSVLQPAENSAADRCGTLQDRRRPDKTAPGGRNGVDWAESAEVRNVALAAGSKDPW